MTLIEQILYRRLTELHRFSGGPVRTLILADTLGKNDRTVRAYLVRMERQGYVHRHGQRGGWVPGRHHQRTRAARDEDE